MHDFQQRERLSPFNKFAHTANDILEADERNEEYHAT